MLRIEFEYRDEMSRWEWRRQTCTCRSVEEAKRFYGLDGDDCEWRIVSVEDEEKAETEAEAPRLSDFSGEEPWEPSRAKRRKRKRMTDKIVIEFDERTGTALVKRSGAVEEYLVCHGYDPNAGDWEHGTYRDDLAQNA